MAQKQPSQAQKILAYMREHGSITVMEAFTKLKITCLSARIAELRYDNAISVVRENGKNGKHWNRYFLKA